MDCTSDESELRDSTALFIGKGVRTPSQFHCGS
jgi:hypothetical protein